jgi:dTDP-4-dehydrorhamnose 3,5-epimerase-like enzyme
VLFVKTKLSGVYVVDPVRLEGERGFFARIFCQ